MIAPSLVAAHTFLLLVHFHGCLDYRLPLAGFGRLTIEYGNTGVREAARGSRPNSPIDRHAVHRFTSERRRPASSFQSWRNDRRGSAETLLPAPS